MCLTSWSSVVCKVQTNISLQIEPGPPSTWPLTVSSLSSHCTLSLLTGEALPGPCGFLNQEALVYYFAAYYLFGVYLFTRMPVLLNHSFLRLFLASRAHLLKVSALF